MNLKLNLNKINNGLRKFLITNGAEIFNYRSYYGEVFSLAALEMIGEESPLNKVLLDSLSGRDTNKPDFHWEFNKFAITFLSESLCSDSAIERISTKSNYNNSKATNWRLLNYLTRLKRKERVKGLWYLRLLLQFMQGRDGFIRDARSVRSSQYHIFCTALLWDIYTETGEKFVLKRFLMAVDCIVVLTLDSGNCNLLGRGHFQSFAYGPAVFSLLVAYRETKDPKYLKTADSVVQYLVRNQSAEGGVNLIVNANQNKIIIGDYSWSSEEHLGWYPYNNYSDYFSFLFFYLARAQLVLDSIDTSLIFRGRPECSGVNMESLTSIGVRVVRTPAYNSVLSKPGGYWSNYLSIPYVESNGEIAIPVVGGEQFQRSLYSGKMNSVPTCGEKEIKILMSFYIGPLMICACKYGFFVRRYRFGVSKIKIETFNFLLFRGVQDNFSFMENTSESLQYDLKINDKKLSDYTSQHSCEGQKGFSANGILNVVSISPINFYSRIVVIFPGVK